jgi:hypothetical protein
MGVVAGREAGSVEGKLPRWLTNWMGEPGIPESQSASSVAIASMRVEATERFVGRVLSGTNSENSRPERVFRVWY